LRLWNLFWAFKGGPGEQQQRQQLEKSCQDKVQ